MNSGIKLKIENFADVLNYKYWIFAPSIGAGVGAMALSVFKKRSRR